MSKYNKILQISLLVVLLGILAAGIVNIFSLRFSHGDLYPKYSTFRPDPFGCKALYDSFNELGLNSRRHFKTMDKLTEYENTLFIRTGISSMRDLTKSKGVNDFIFNGGHFIGFFNPHARVFKKSNKDKTKSNPSDTNAENDKKECDHNDSATEEKPKEDSDISEVKKVKKKIMFRKILACELRTKHYSKSEKAAMKFVAYPADSLKQSDGFYDFPLYTTNFFEIKHDDWQILYSSKDGPVVVMRKLGQGKIILCSTSYFVSNEGLRKHRNSKLLCLFKENRNNIVFDEFSLGVQEERNIVWLFGKYKLQYLLINLGVIVLFFLWYNFAALSNIVAIPEKSYLHSETIKSSLSSASGLNTLITKTIKPNQVLKTCIDEWLKTVKIRNISKNKIKSIKKILNNNINDKPVTVYRLIQQVLSERNSGIEND